MNLFYRVLQYKMVLEMLGTQMVMVLSIPMEEEFIVMTPSQQLKIVLSKIIQAMMVVVVEYFAIMLLQYFMVV